MYLTNKKVHLCEVPKHNNTTPNINISSKNMLTAYIFLLADFMIQPTKHRNSCPRVTVGLSVQ